MVIAASFLVQGSKTKNNLKEKTDGQKDGQLQNNPYSYRTNNVQQYARLVRTRSRVRYFWKLIVATFPRKASYLMSTTHKCEYDSSTAVVNSG